MTIGIIATSGPHFDNARMAAPADDEAATCCGTAHALSDLADARARVRAHARRLSSVRIRLATAEGHVLAQPVRSVVDLPPFDNSAMDGFALRWCDLQAEDPSADGDILDVQTEQAAGDGPAQHRGGAVAIMTGARMPDGADTVVPIERVEILGRAADGEPLRIRLRERPLCGQHVRRAGEDIAAGDVAIAAGTRLDAAGCMLLRGAGVAEVEAVRPPRVALFCTGRELIDNAGATLAPGQIHNTNRPYLASRLTQAGAQVIVAATLPDETARFVDAVRHALDAGVDMVISTGAVSMGRYDFVPDALAMLGAHVVFHRVAMRPGKPLLFAVLPGGALFFGLPGNPVSSAVGERFFVETALRAMLGMPDERVWRLPLAEDVRKKPGFHLYQKAELRLGNDGRVAVALLKGQESFRTRPLLRARVWAGLPAAVDALAAGDLIDVHPLCHFHDDFFASP